MPRWVEWQKPQLEEADTGVLLWSIEVIKAAHVLNFISNVSIGILPCPPLFFEVYWKSLLHGTCFRNIQFCINLNFFRYQVTLTYISLEGINAFAFPMKDVSWKLTIFVDFMRVLAPKHVIVFELGLFDTLGGLFSFLIRHNVLYYTNFIVSSYLKYHIFIVFSIAENEL